METLVPSCCPAVIRASLILLLTVTLAAGALRASDRQVQNPSAPMFRSEANLVVLHVNVFDRDGDSVPRLAREHFRVLEDGQPQEVNVFSNEDLPVTVGLVIDNSSSMITRNSLVVAGAMAFANSSHPADELFVVSFTEDVRLALPESVAFTSSRSLLQATLLSLRPGGKTAVYDAVIRALDHVERTNHQKRVIIVLSDGDDNASHHTREQMFARAEASDVLIFAVGIDSRSTGQQADPRMLRRLARAGGGTAYFPRTEREMVRHFEEIAANIRQGYTIGYVPRDAHPGARFRRIEVTVDVPGRQRLEVRHRRGYRVP
jgi:VWFA-related protein